MATTMAGGYAPGRQYQQYQRASVETADRGELLLILYRGAIRFLQRGIAAMRAADVPTAHASLVRVQDIVAELRASLNAEAGDVATHLDRIYEYLQWRLVRANCEKDVAPAEEVLGILQSLLSAWEVAVRSVRAEVEPARPARAGAAL
jgi:flagellar secretion chaperone FliS